MQNANEQIDNVKVNVECSKNVLVNPKFEATVTPAHNELNVKNDVKGKENDSDQRVRSFDRAGMREKADDDPVQNESPECTVKIGTRSSKVALCVHRIEHQTKNHGGCNCDGKKSNVCFC